MGTFPAMTSTMPPMLSRVASISAIIRSVASGSEQRTGDSSTGSQLTVSGMRADMGPMESM